MDLPASPQAGSPQDGATAASHPGHPGSPRSPEMLVKECKEHWAGSQQAWRLFLVTLSSPDPPWASVSPSVNWEWQSCFPESQHCTHLWVPPQQRLPSGPRTRFNTASRLLLPLFL